MTFGVGGLLFGVTAGKYRIAGGAESLPQRLFLPVRALHGGLPLGLCELGGFDGDAQIGVVRQILNLLDQLLAPCQLPLTFDVKVRVQAPQDLLETTVDGLAVGAVDRSELVPLFAGTAAQSIGLAPVHLPPVGCRLELFQLLAKRHFLVEIVLALAGLGLEIGLARGVGTLAGVVETVP